MFIAALLLASSLALDWNEGVSYYEKGDVTNALRVLQPLTSSSEFGARASEIVAKLEYERGEIEAAAYAAQRALSARPNDERLKRNLARAMVGLEEDRRRKRVDTILKEYSGKSPENILKESMNESRALVSELSEVSVLSPSARVGHARTLSKRASKLQDSWIPVREAIAHSVTNEQEAVAIMSRLDVVEKSAGNAVDHLEDLEEREAFSDISANEAEFTAFYKLVAMPPATLAEDIVCQSNAWNDVETIGGRAWSREALDYTKAFRAKFPYWAKQYEAQAASNTNAPPFTAESQARISALATELEKLQLSIVDKEATVGMERAMEILQEIDELMPKDKGQGEGSEGEKDQSQGGDKGQDQGGDDERKREESAAVEQEADDQALQKVEERTNEYEDKKRAYERRMPLPQNERDW